MKNSESKNTKTATYNLKDSCGNCWGHQEYKEEYAEKLVDISRGKKDNFLSRFVKKYLTKQIEVIVQYSKLTEEIKAVENRLQQLSLQYKIEEKEALEDIVLIEGKNRHLGLDRIHSLLDQLESEREQWYYCNC